MGWDGVAIIRQSGTELNYKKPLSKRRIRVRSDIVFDSRV